jgi:hypothetical protein
MVIMPVKVNGLPLIKVLGLNIQHYRGHSMKTSYTTALMLSLFVGLAMPAMRHDLMGLFAKGTAVTLGPFTEETTALGGAIGFVLLRVASKDEAIVIMNADPTISRKIFSYELVGVLLPPSAKASGKSGI